jgi:transposase-like protein
MPPPLDPDKRHAIAQAIREGGHRNAIAREHDVAGSTVGKIAKELEAQGELDAPPFDRAQTQRAREALDQDQALNRARLQALLLSDAHRLREQLWLPCVMHNFGGRDNTHNSIDLPQPTFEQQKAIMSAVSLAVDRVVRLDNRSEEAEKQAASLIKGLVDDIRSRRKTEPEAAA